MEATPLIVLIVDDDPDHADVLAELFAVRGHTAHIARDAARGLELATSLHADMILVDVLLPDLPGDQLVSRMRSAGVRSRIVVTTGYPKHSVRDAAMKAGADVYMLKPFTLAAIDAEMQAAAKARG